MFILFVILFLPVVIYFANIIFSFNKKPRKGKPLVPKEITIKYKNPEKEKWQKILDNVRNNRDELLNIMWHQLGLKHFNINNTEFDTSVQKYSYHTQKESCKFKRITDEIAKTVETLNKCDTFFDYVAKRNQELNDLILRYMIPVKTGKLIDIWTEVKKGEHKGFDLDVNLYVKDLKNDSRGNYSSTWCTDATIGTIDQIFTNIRFQLQTIIEEQNLTPKTDFKQMTKDLDEIYEPEPT